MAQGGISMRMLSEVLRLKLEKGLPIRQVSSSCKLARSTVSDYLSRARVAGLSWPLPEGMDDEALNKLLFPDRPKTGGRLKPDLEYIRNEMRRQSWTLQRLWEEYRRYNTDGYGYSQYCHMYRGWLRRQEYCLRQEHRAGDKLFVDFAGDTIPIFDVDTGESTPAHIFVGVLGCSNYTYAQATWTEQMDDWIDAQIKAMEYIGGVTNAVVPDNPKPLVSSPCWYDPEINRTYQEMAEHYGFAVLPARPGKARDKAKVENGVLVVERWILAALRNRKFFSLGELNDAIRELIERLNARPFKKIKGSRREVFEQVERPALKPLPVRRYELAHWKNVTLNIDYHAEIDGHYYSAPYHLIRQKLTARYTGRTVELYHKGKRVAVHGRSHQKGRHSTIMEHRPPAHQRYLEWGPERIMSWASSIGEDCGRAIKFLMESRSIPEHAYRSCLGILRLGRIYGNDRLNRACTRAIKCHVVSYRQIDSMLKSGRDRLALEPAPEPAVVVHDNLRGAQYYREEAAHAV